MEVRVASRNPVKVQAAEDAFALQFPGRDISFVACDSDSGVSGQPLSDRETLSGARNRASDVRGRHPGADYWVGIEGGIELMDGVLTAFAWISVLDRSGRRGEARTVTLPLPPAVKSLVDQGLELGEANDRVFSTVNSKQRGGAFGLLTDGIHTRQSVYTQALVIALVPLVNELYVHDREAARRDS